MTKRPRERKLLHVGVTLANPARAKAYERVFGKAKDWFRYAPNCWILWTSVSAGKWANRMRAIVREGKESFLVCELNFKNHEGWLTRESWDWINSKAFGKEPQEQQTEVTPAQHSD